MPAATSVISSPPFRSAACGKRLGGFWASPANLGDGPPRNPTPRPFSRSAAALAIWQASHTVEHTLVITYLRSRGLDLPASPSLRFHADLKHPSGGVWPAMVALVTHAADPDRRLPFIAPFSPVTPAARRQSIRRRLCSGLVVAVRSALASPAPC